MSQSNEFIWNNFVASEMCPHSPEAINSPLPPPKYGGTSFALEFRKQIGAAGIKMTARQTRKSSTAVLHNCRGGKW